jgi:amino acid transporter
VGIEFVCSLTEEVRTPRRAMPRGIVIGLLVILGTSWLMGLGVAGTTPPGGGAWGEVALGAAGCDGSCPQLAVGEGMFGGTGRGLMALASVFATLGSLVVSFAALPRIIFGIARNGEFFGPQLSRAFARLHPRWETPVVAIVFFVVASTVLAMFSNDVVDWIFSGAYVWILMYVAFHAVAFAKRLLRPGLGEVFGPWFWAVPVVGAPVTLVALHYAFVGVHGDYLPRALIVLGVAGVATVVDFLLSRGHAGEPPPVPAPTDTPTPRPRPAG